MPDDNWDDDEDWYDNDAADEEETACCPECGGLIHPVAECCPECGYWISEADRRAMWARMSKPLWLKVTAVVVLAAFLVSILAVAIDMF